MNPPGAACLAVTNALHARATRAAALASQPSRSQALNAWHDVAKASFGIGRVKLA